MKSKGALLRVGLLTTLLLAAMSSMAQTQEVKVWGHVASACAVDEQSLKTYQTAGAELTFQKAGFGTVQARCNVTNPLDVGQKPGWNRLIVSYRDPDNRQTGNRVKVTLLRLNVTGTPATEPLGSVHEVVVMDSATYGGRDSGVASVAVSFTHEVDFVHAYFVLIELTRAPRSLTAPSVLQVALDSWHP
jgi:hypothetical protein